MPQPLTLIADDRMALHVSTTPGHPERPERLRAVTRRLRDDPVALATWSTPAPAPAEALARVHDAAYVEQILALDGLSKVLDADTSVTSASIQAALLSAGAALEMVEGLVDPQRPDRVFALTRPPGHHAERGRAMGFCLFGNVALAAVHAIENLGLQRVAIVDWDVHHGNGTQNLLYDRGDILVFGVHQDGIYPGSGSVREVGAGEGLGATINVPLPAGVGDGALLAAFDDVLAPALERFNPELLLVSAGFDAHVHDPLGGLTVTTAGFAALCGRVVALADRHCRGRVGLALEGGYDIDALADSVRATAGVLVGEPPPEIEAGPGAARAAIDRARAQHGL